MGETHAKSEVGMYYLNRVKVGLETTFFSFIFLAFSHAFSNAIRSHPICPRNLRIILQIPLRPKTNPSLSQSSKSSNVYSLKLSNPNAPSLANIK
jgi:hypothetical protein